MGMFVAILISFTVGVFLGAIGVVVLLHDARGDYDE